ncbi:MAG: hypothetical protein M1324_03130 [Patescibacteria group bacterium]|nr:hypothetical protein [Patescibacteria group bacterium]
MDREQKRKFADEIDKAVLDKAGDLDYWMKRRQRWDEWGSPVGLSLGWALFIIPLGVFLYLLHLAGILK